MFTNNDVHRAAELLINKHGAHAALVAEDRARALLVQGNIDASIIWTRIAAAIRELQK